MLEENGVCVRYADHFIYKRNQKHHICEEKSIFFWPGLQLGGLALLFHTASLLNERNPTIAHNLHNHTTAQLHNHTATKTKQPNNQTTKQPNNQTTKQPNNQTTNQPTNHTTTQLSPPHNRVHSFFFIKTYAIILTPPP